MARGPYKEERDKKRKECVTPRTRDELIELYGIDDVWYLDELKKQFEIVNYLDPYLEVHERFGERRRGYVVCCINPEKDRHNSHYLYFQFQPSISSGVFN